MKYFYLLLVLFSFRCVNAQYKIEVLDSNTFTLGEGVVLSKISFRGLSVVDDKTIWASGSRGTIARSIDGGKTFHYSQIKGYEKSDFRDIEAFDDKRAIIMSSGTPAYILKTNDGGKTWKEVYKNLDTAYFLDAMDFWDEQRGIIVGDPIHKHFLLLQTNDGGETWQELDTTKTPTAFDGEAVFAASGTSLRCWGKKDFGFVSGGKYSRFFLRNPIREEFITTEIDIQKGENSTGAFSFINQNKRTIAVGGNYTKDTLRYKNLDEIGKRLYYEDMGVNPFGYRSCIEALSKEQFVLCGSNGVDFFYHQKHFIESISTNSFHVVCKAKNGKAVFLAGPKGKIGKLVY
jgi:hypothetical protein